MTTVTESAVITFYNINKCGYYRSGEATPSFGGTAEMLRDLAGWARGKSLKETKTFEADDNRYPSYLLDTYTSGSDSMLLLWNEIPTNGQRLPSISETSTFGSDLEVIMNEVANGSIPGYATYFWVLPEINKFATIRLHNRLTAQSSFQHYISCFLKQSSQHVVCQEITREDGSLGIDVSGYKFNINDPNEENYFYQPLFKASMTRNPGNHEFIRRNAARVSKIERLSELDVSEPDDLTLWQSLLSKLGMSAETATAPDATKIRYTVSPSVELTDINRMIEEWETDSHTNNDFAFYFQGESGKAYWLSKSLARVDFELNIIRENAEIVRLDSLHSELTRLKQQILNNSGI